MLRPALSRWLPCVLQLLQVAHLAQSALTSPYSCKMDGGVFRMQHDFDTQMIVGVKGLPPSFVTLYESKEDGAVSYQITLTDRTFMRIDREGGDVAMPMSLVTQRLAPRDLLSEVAIHYFWIRAKDGEIAFGRAGQDEPLLKASDPAFKKPTSIRFRSNSLWVHSCSASNPPNPPLGCSKVMLTDRYDFSEAFSVRDEEVSLDGEKKAIRFMVRGARDAYVRLKGSPSFVYYEIDLNFVNKIAIQRINAYLDQKTCHNCLSAAEFRLFTVVYNATHVELFEGAELTSPALSVKLMAFKITSISFASMSSSGSVHWMHACQGYKWAPLAAGVTQPPPALPVPLPVPLSPQARAEALNSTELVGCRMVHTFKYRFDGYFSFGEEGLVSGPTSVLPFRVLGRKDIHLQLVSSIPPDPDEVYEIDIDFYNHTNLDRGKDMKVASAQHQNLLSGTELRDFLLVHDMVTGVINITTGDGRAILVWRDPKPFPLRYFSICSGSSAGNDTTWVFGCPGYPKSRPDTERLKSGCSRPLLTFTYSHSQYLSVRREGVVSGSQRTLYLFLRAKGSGHVRLETTLPPAVDALFEVDLSHEGNTSIDTLGKRVASVQTPGLLSPREQRGFWLRQDMERRRLEVGRIGSEEPLLSWTAPAAAKFPEVRLFSLATSRSAGNGTWYYGCKEGHKPEDEEESQIDVAEHIAPQDPIDYLDVPSLTFTDDDDDYLSYGSFAPFVPIVPKVTPGDAARATPHQSASSLLSRRLIPLMNIPPPDGASITAKLSITKASLEDYMGFLSVRGHLSMVWTNPNITWEPKDYNNIYYVRMVDSDRLWTPDLTVRNGVIETTRQPGSVYAEHSGLVRWEAPLRAMARCRLLARDWPRDRHTCDLNITLVGSGRRRHSLSLQPDREHREYRDGEPSDWVEKSAGSPFWRLLSLSASVHADEAAPTGTSGATGAQGGSRGTTIRIVASMQRAMAVLHHILLAPFVVVSALCLLAYWVREPLPRDKVVLGCGSLMFLVLSFLVLEAACPAGLMGMPTIVDVYCWCMCVLALSIVASAILTALSRDRPGRSPPAILCKLLSLPLVRWALILHIDQADQGGSEDEMQPDREKGSKHVYMQFDQENNDNCRCGKKSCSKQVTMEAQYYWTLLAMACERILSILCFVLLLFAAILML